MIRARNVSVAWVQAVKHIISGLGRCLNLMVQIETPTERELDIDLVVDSITTQHGLLSIRQVAYSIFPQRLYEVVNKDRGKLYDRYNRRVYRVVRGQWGSYFKRMIDWPFIKGGKHINQLEITISKLNERERSYKAAYTLLICSPERNFAQPRGAPCLNYLALQLEPTDRTIGLLAVYRNHDFIGKAYGNYVGLADLQNYICEQTGFEPGILTVLSSQAYVHAPPPRKELERILEEFS